LGVRRSTFSGVSANCLRKNARGAAGAKAACDYRKVIQFAQEGNAVPGPERQAASPD